MLIFGNFLQKCAKFCKICAKFAKICAKLCKILHIFLFFSGFSPQVRTGLLGDPFLKCIFAQKSNSLVWGSPRCRDVHNLQNVLFERKISPSHRVPRAPKKSPRCTIFPKNCKKMHFFANFGQNFQHDFLHEKLKKCVIGQFYFADFDQKWGSKIRLFLQIFIRQEIWSNSASSI